MSVTRTSKRRKLSHTTTLFKPEPPRDEKDDTEMATLTHRQFGTGHQHAALLIHGGCFVKGDENWNKDQAAAIAAKCERDVFTLDFSKASLSHSLKDIKTFYQDLYEKYQGQVGLIGCSSGGFLTLKLLTLISRPEFVVLVCPVMDPAQREDMLPESRHSQNIRENQRQYFGERPYPTAESIDLPMHVIAAKQDENVPLKLIEAECKRFPEATLYRVDGEHALSFKNYKVVNDIVRSVTELLEEKPYKLKKK